MAEKDESAIRLWTLDDSGVAADYAASFSSGLVTVDREDLGRLVNWYSRCGVPMGDDDASFQRLRAALEGSDQ